MIENLIHGLCEYIGIPPLDPDPDGVYEIVFDEGLFIEILPISGSKILIRAEIGTLPQERDEWDGYLKQRLRDNMLVLREQSSTVSLDAENGQLWLYHLIGVGRTTVFEFCEILSAFTVCLDWWNSRGESAPSIARLPQGMPFNFIQP